MNYVKLNNGIEMPQMGYGVCQVSPQECGTGGQGKQHTTRSEIWITSKLWPTEYGEGKTAEAIDKMLKRLGTDYIDLLYVHQPVGDFVGAWRDMERAVEASKVRALGISNFDVNDSVFNLILKEARIKPSVFQMECHPYAQRLKVRERAKAEGIQECWFPLGGAMSQGALLKDPTIQKIAEAHGKSAAQIILRWHIQVEGFSVIPGATNPDYIKENIQIFDFELTDEEMQAMRSFNKEQRFFNASLEQAEQFGRMPMKN